MARCNKNEETDVSVGIIIIMFGVLFFLIGLAILLET